MDTRRGLFAKLAAAFVVAPLAKAGLWRTPKPVPVLSEGMRKAVLNEEPLGIKQRRLTYFHEHGVSLEWERDGETFVATYRAPPHLHAFHRVQNRPDRTIPVLEGQNIVNGQWEELHPTLVTKRAAT